MANDNGRKRPVCLRKSLCNVWLAIAVLSLSTTAIAEPPPIAYTSIAIVYGPLWIPQRAGIFQKHGIDPEFIYTAGGPPSLQADKRTALATFGKYTEQKTTPAVDRIYQIDATKHFKRIPEATLEGIKNDLGRDRCDAAVTARDRPRAVCRIEIRS